jgi:hypothetical protein
LCDLIPKVAGFGNRRFLVIWGALVWH